MWTLSTWFASLVWTVYTSRTHVQQDRHTQGGGILSMQIQPYLFFDGRCEEAIDFYRRTLGAEVE